MPHRTYPTHRQYLTSRIRVLQYEVEHGRHAAFREQSRIILTRLCGELDDMDAATAERVV